ncbi:hypothetical protein EJ06DRAFT_524408 [Trichodelitschia bisporula]|uniref:Thioredoxin-like protein n=1 Tax=Trichodelitschia bisporula TaxID=703511 RepID=A0A6G1HLR8_9PEZI|nr:hypothetical protein EJ06DRAFT_524408 [Trichodelitschia bisporula]
MPASSAAQDEFNAMMAAQRPRQSRHPADSRSPSPSTYSSTQYAEKRAVRQSTATFFHASDSEDDEDDAPLAATIRGVGANATYYVPRQRSDANTGPKGVIADAQAFEAARRRAGILGGVRLTAQSDVSLMVEACVRELARQYPTTRFVKLHYEEAEMDAMGVPALLAYRHGDKFAGLVPVMDEIPEEEELSAKTLGAVLKRHRVL